jgi:uncharacterized membrane protein
MAAHPIHPALVHFPIALLLSATIADLGQITAVWPEPRFAALLMAAGLAGGLVAMAAGLYDFSRLDDSQVPHAMRHMAAVGLAWLGYGLALYLRREALSDDVTAPVASLAVSLASAAVLSLGGWLGGELVYRYGAGQIER